MSQFEYSEYSICQEVLDFMHSFLIYPVYRNLILDGKIHRFRTKHDKSSETSGAYCISLEDWPHGFVQDWRLGDPIPWSLQREKLGNPISDEEYKKRIELSRKHQEELKKKLEQELIIGSEKARIFWESLTKSADNSYPYLLQKNVPSFGLKIDDSGNLIIPLYNIDGRVQSYQSISPNGDKRFAHNASVSGVFFPFSLGFLDKVSSLPLIVAEGYATAATLYMLTNYPCVAAMNCGNLGKVVDALRNKYPKATFIIAADNDWENEKNSGIEAAKKINGVEILYPEFSNGDEGLSDWNDFAHKYGNDTAKSILTNKIDYFLMPQNIKNMLPQINSINAHDLYNKVFPPIKWAVEGFLPAGLTILGGAPKTGKSILALHLAVGVAIGGCVLGKINVTQGDVLYLALEDTERRLQKRIKESVFMENDYVPLHHLDLITTIPRQHEGGLDYITFWLNNHKNSRLVIIDTLQQFRKQLTGKGSMYSEDYEVISQIKKVADKFDVPFLIIHHLKKARDDDDWLNEFSGSQGISGSADTLFSIKRMRTDKYATLHRTGRDVEEKDFRMRLDGFGWVLEDSIEAFTMPEWKKQILDYLKEHETVTPMELSEKYNLPIKTAQTQLMRMMKDGELQKLGHGKYSKL